MKKISFLLLLSFFYLGCTNSSIYNKNLSTYTIESSIVENQTTQKDIENIFGNPYSVDINSDGNTVWTYRDITINSPGYNSFSASFRAGKGGRSRDNHNPQYKWVLIFDSNGVVTSSDVRSLY